MNTPSPAGLLTNVVLKVALSGTLAGVFLVLAIVRLALTPIPLSAGQEGTDPAADHPCRFRVLQGQVGLSAQGATLAPFPSPQEAMLSCGKTEVNAGSFLFLAFDIQAPLTGLSMILFWRTAEHPGAFLTLDLPPGAGTLFLGRQDGWQGRIMEYGLGLRGTAEQGLLIRELSLRTASPSSLIETWWTEWNSVQPWEAGSINFLDYPKTRLWPSPMVVLALWWLLASVLALLLFRFRKRPALMAATIYFCGAWGGLDLLWSRELRAKGEHSLPPAQVQRQAISTQDEGLLDFAAEIRPLIAPTDRVLVLAADPFARLRLGYHLLPLNSLAYLADPPPARLLRQGDILILLTDQDPLAPGQLDPLSFTPPGTKLALLHSSPIGQAYRLVSGSRASGKN